MVCPRDVRKFFLRNYDARQTLSVHCLARCRRHWALLNRIYIAWFELIKPPSMSNNDDNVVLRCVLHGLLNFCDDWNFGTRTTIWCGITLMWLLLSATNKWVGSAISSWISSFRRSAQLVGSARCEILWSSGKFRYITAVVLRHWLLMSFLFLNWFFYYIFYWYNFYNK